MTVEKIYIVRHGFRLNWVSTDWLDVTGLPRDPPLAAYGEKQAQELGAYFLSIPEKERPTAIFSSPYYRCLQTAKPIANALGISVYVEHGIGEWYSPVAPNTGLHPRPGSAISLQQYFPEIDPSWSSIYYPSRKGEEVDQVHERAETFLRALIPRVERVERHARIMLVSHAATVITLARALVGKRDLPLRVGCCTVTELVRHKDGDPLGVWTAVRLADGSPLTGGTSRDWGFEDIEIAEGKVVHDPGVDGTQNEIDEPVGLYLSKM
ncbi:hypothetical protein M378DRAFT_67173 [Amanita muscaria Koide BX008]|uniref:Phosphoglycerate mutase-like protein n=1 Tax=Amanita muscaria (strain Koide BX008) TaxID=946122 RepID=A0A0C2X8S0_AMAMK|nr:hypothetical protein M378DRAFT_67173 [Amanita muscaria Koide BX008]